MGDVIDCFGQNAGKIWEKLYNAGPLDEQKLLSTTNLNSNELYAAIGWLARENKISRTNTQYRLAETNLMGKIGVDAGRIWRVLDTWGDIDITSIVRLSRLPEKDVYAALGWLAREGKISSEEVTYSGQKRLKFSLK